MNRRRVRDVCRDITQLSNKLALAKQHQLQDVMHHGVYGKADTLARIEAREPQLADMTRRLESLRAELGAMLDSLTRTTDERAKK